jgi:hypothetical protein
MKNAFKYSMILLVAVSGLFLSGCSKETLDNVSAPVVNITTPVTTSTAAPSLKTANGDVQIASVILYAGQTINAGNVSVSQTDTDGDLAYDSFKVIYTLTGGWLFNGTESVKFYLGTTVPDNNAPGQFLNKYTPEAGVTTYSVTFPFSAVNFNGCDALTVYIAAHADLINGSQTETGWGFGPKFGGRGWSTYFSADLTDKTTPKASDVTSTVECIGSVPAPDASVITDATDNCTLPAVPVTYVDGSETSVGTCPTIVTRQYLVSDAAGNNITVTQTITVHDVTKPVLAGQGADIALSCDLTFTAPTASDNCDSNPVITFTDAVAGTTTTRTWVATDACGNVSEAVKQSITLDKTAPVLTLVGSSIATIACSATPNFTTPTATDNNTSVAPTVTVAGADLVETVTGATWTTRTWTATDACGNTSSISQKIINDCTFNINNLNSWLPGAGTGWAFDKDGTSKAFNTLTPKTGNNWGWTNFMAAATTNKTYELYVGAGQNVMTKGIPVGEVVVTKGGANIIVTYTVVSSCKITEAHLWVGTTPLPLNKQKSYVSAPGQLGYNATSLTVNTYTFTVPNTFGTKDIYVAAHAVIEVR